MTDFAAGDRVELVVLRENRPRGTVVELIRLDLHQTPRVLVRWDHDWSMLNQTRGQLHHLDQLEKLPLLDRLAEL